MERLHNERPKLYRKLARLYLDELEDKPGLIREDFRRGEVESAADRLHSLSGSAAALGLNSLRHLALALEARMRAQEGVSTEELDAVLDRYAEDSRIVHPFLERD